MTLDALIEKAKEIGARNEQDNAGWPVVLSPEVVIALCEVTKAAETAWYNGGGDSWLETALAHLDDVMGGK